MRTCASGLRGSFPTKSLCACDARRANIKEDHISLDSVGIKDASRESKDGVQFHVLKQVLPHGLACAAFEEHIVRYDHRSSASSFEHGVYVLHKVELLVRSGGPKVRTLQKFETLRAIVADCSVIISQSIYVLLTLLTFSRILFDAKMGKLSKIRQ